MRTNQSEQTQNIICSNELCGNRKQHLYSWHVTSLVFDNIIMFLLPFLLDLLSLPCLVLLVRWPKIYLFYCPFHLHKDSEIQSSTDKCIFYYHQSNVRLLLPAPNTANRAAVKLLSTVQSMKQCLEVAESREEPPNIWLNYAFVDWALNCVVRMLLKGSVICSSLI